MKCYSPLFYLVKQNIIETAKSNETWFYLQLGLYPWDTIVVCIHILNCHIKFVFLWILARQFHHQRSLFLEPVLIIGENVKLEVKLTQDQQQHLSIKQGGLRGPLELRKRGANECRSRGNPLQTSCLMQRFKCHSQFKAGVRGRINVIPILHLDLIAKP